MNSNVTSSSPTQLYKLQTHTSLPLLLPLPLELSGVSAISIDDVGDADNEQLSSSVEVAATPSGKSMVGLLDTIYKGNKQGLISMKSTRENSSDA